MARVNNSMIWRNVIRFNNDNWNSTGIYLAHGSSNNTVNGNIAENNSYGIGCDGGHNNLFIDNVANYQEYGGFWLDKSSWNNKIISNSAFGNKEEGIGIYGNGIGSRHNVIEHNYVARNKQGFIIHGEGTRYLSMCKPGLPACMTITC